MSRVYPKTIFGPMFYSWGNCPLKGGGGGAEVEGFHKGQKIMCLLACPIFQNTKIYGVLLFGVCVLLWQNTVSQNACLSLTCIVLASKVSFGHPKPQKLPIKTSKYFCKSVLRMSIMSI